MRDAAHPAERQDELEHGDVANSRQDEEQNVDANQRSRLAVSVHVQTVAELRYVPLHQPLGVVHDADRRRLYGTVDGRRQVIELHPRQRR